MVYMALRVDLGCGPYKSKGWLGVDVYPFDGVDIVYDGDRLPFDDSTVDEIRAMHVMEHIPNIFNLMREIHRVCKNGAIITITSPHFTSCHNHYDFEHVRRFGYRSFSHIYGHDPVETLSPHAVHGFIVTKAVRFEWWEHRTLIKKSWWLRAILTPIDFVLSKIATAYPFFMERIWGRWVGGFDDIIYTLEVEK